MARLKVLPEDLATEFKASPEKIGQHAARARALSESLLGHMKTIEEKVDMSSYFWSSDSSNLLYKYFRQDKLDYDEMKRRLNKNIEKLNSIAAMYESAERAVESEISALPDTIIE